MNTYVTVVDAEAFARKRMAAIARRRAERVAEVAAHLDAAWRDRGGWAHRIDIGRLNLASFDCCLFGQLYAPTGWQWAWWQRRRSGWVRGCRVLRTWEWAPDLLIACADDERYHDLWIAAIAERLYPVQETAPAERPHAGALV